MKYGKFDVYMDGEAAGKLEISLEGLLTYLDCTAECETDEVLRLAADVGDDYTVIGVMMPAGKGFRLKKYLTKNDVYLKRLNDARRYVLITDKVQYPKEEPEESEAQDGRIWTVCNNPAELFCDREAGEAVLRCEGVLKAEHEGLVYIAVPVLKEKPFPALPIFYFGQRGILNGSEYLLFTLKDGQLQI